MCVQQNISGEGQGSLTQQDPPTLTCALKYGVVNIMGSNDRWTICTVYVDFRYTVLCLGVFGASFSTNYRTSVTGWVVVAALTCTTSDSVWVRKVFKSIFVLGVPWVTANVWASNEDTKVTGATAGRTANEFPIRWFAQMIGLLGSIEPPLSSGPGARHLLESSMALEVARQRGREIDDAVVCVGGGSA